MKTHSLKTLLALTFLVAAGSGCLLADKTLEDWRAEQDAETRGKVQVFSGDYRGTIRLPGSDGSLFEAPMEMHLEDCILPGSGTTVSGSTQTSVCGRVTLHLDEPLTLSFEQAAFDAVRREFRAQAGSTTTGEVAVEGTIVEDSLSGRLFMSEYLDQSGDYVLVRDAALPAPADAAALSKSAPGRRADAWFQAYRGRPQFFDGGENLPVSMAIQRTVAEPDAQFAECFMPVRRVTVSFALGAGVETVFTDAVWDLRTQTITGAVSSAGTPGRPSYALQFACAAEVIEYKASPSTLAWRCRYYSLVNHAGLLFDGLFTPEDSANERRPR